MLFNIINNLNNTLNYSSRIKERFNDSDSVLIASPYGDAPGSFREVLRVKGNNKII